MCKICHKLRAQTCMATDNKCTNKIPESVDCTYIF